MNPLRLIPPALLCLLVTACASGTVNTNPGDTDPGQETSQPDCAATAVACDDDGGCADCLGGGFVCCDGQCAAQCASDGDGEQTDPEPCSAVGLECAEAADCLVYCPGSAESYVCADHTCQLHGYDGDVDQAEPEPEPEPELPEESEPEPEEDPCFTGMENRAPVVQPVADKAVEAGSLLTTPILAADSDPCDTLTYSCASCPTGSGLDTLSDPPLFTWTPAVSQQGRHEVTISVTDNGRPVRMATVSFFVTVTVTPTNHPPVIAPITDRQVLTSHRLTFTTGISDPDGDTIRFVVAQLPDYLALSIEENRRLVITFDAARAQGAGVYEPVFSLTDGQGGVTEGSFRMEVRAAPAGEDCAHAVVFLMGDRYEGATDGHTNSLAPGPPDVEGAMNGPDLFFTLVRQPPGAGADRLRIIVAPLDASFDAGVHLWPSGCGDIITGDDIRPAGVAEALILKPEHSSLNGLVAVVDSAGQGGGFSLTADYTDLTVTANGLCQPCQFNHQCGYQGDCVAFVRNNTVLETACGDNCDADNDCPKGMACRDMDLVDRDQKVKQCAPDYYTQGFSSHDIATCEALRELDDVCDPGAQDQEAQCGADSVASVDDADCYHSDHPSISPRCTVRCNNNNQCPQGYTCQNWDRWQGWCLP